MWCDWSDAWEVCGHDMMEIIILSIYWITQHRRYQRIQIGSNYCSWREIINGVPQGSILAPTIFNINLIDLFFLTTLSEIDSYADDNNPYTCRNKPDLIVEKLMDDSDIIFEWVNCNALKANPDKFHLSNSNDDEIYIDIDNHKIYNSPRKISGYI